MKRLGVLLLGLVAPAILAGCVESANLTPAGLSDTLADAPAFRPPVVHDAQGNVLDALPDAFGSGYEVVGRLVGAVGAEPNIGITSSGSAFVTAFDSVLRSQDGGQTWEVVHRFGLEAHGAPFDPVRTSDPMLWVDPVTDRIFVPQMFPILACSQAVWSDDDGETWNEKPMSCGIPVVDHQKLATGAWRDENPLAAAATYEQAVYYCYNKLVSTNCATSLDGGLNYAYDTVVWEGECAGVNGHPATAPDGTLFVPIGGLGSCDQLYVGVSKDNGLTWTVERLKVGDLGLAQIDPDITVTPDGTAYYTWRAASDNRVYMVRSTDDFATTEGPFLVSPPDVTSTRFAVITSGSDGRVALSYIGTRDTDSRPNNAPDDTRWHLFVSYTLDAAAANPTFVTVQVTPEDDPVQVGYSWESGGGDPGRNLLDFNDMHTGPDGRFYVAYTDGCVTNEAFDCAGNPDAKPEDSRAREVAVAVLEAGPSLLAEQGTLRAPAGSA